MCINLIEHSVVLLRQPPKKNNPLSIPFEKCTDFTFLSMKKIFKDYDGYYLLDKKENYEFPEFQRIMGKLEFENKVIINKEPIKLIIMETFQPEETVLENHIDEIALRIFEKTIEEKKGFSDCGINFAYSVKIEDLKQPVVSKIFKSVPFFREKETFNGHIGFSEKIDEKTSFNITIIEPPIHKERDDFIIKYNINYKDEYLTKHIKFLEKHSSFEKTITNKNKEIIKYLKNA